MKLSQLTLAAAASMALTVGLTIYGELNPEFKTLMTNLSGHHWITKSLAVPFSLVIFYFLSSLLNADKITKNKEAWVVVLTGFFGGLILLTFFIIHYK
jgi:hypothetical protein